MPRPSSRRESAQDDAEELQLGPFGRIACRGTYTILDGREHGLAQAANRSGRRHLREHNIPYEGAPRYVTRYALRAADGSEREVVAEAVDGSLPRSMANGTRIRKQRGQLDYQRDGQWVRFPIYFYATELVTALAFVAARIALYAKSRRPNPP